MITSAPTPKQVHIIGSNGCGPPENWEKNFGPPPKERNQRAFDQRANQYNQQGGMSGRSHGCGRDPFTYKPLYCMYHDSDTNHHTKDCPIFLESKRKMDQASSQPPQQSSSREVNHTTQWAWGSQTEGVVHELS
jgi:hypothetical protein